MQNFSERPPRTDYETNEEWLEAVIHWTEGRNVAYRSEMLTHRINEIRNQLVDLYTEAQRLEVCAQDKTSFGESLAACGAAKPSEAIEEARKALRSAIWTMDRMVVDPEEVR